MFNVYARANIESCDNNVDEVVCPYATFQLSREQQLQLNQQKQQQKQQVNTNKVIYKVCCFTKSLRFGFLELSIGATCSTSRVL